ncbi:hypothetical protein TFLX_04866 [Thermoflexales bacterium]|nr:hypothetical protein TFLX_04866 [Thermoflexales bacterium]
MRRNPERLAWTVLLISLFMCIGLAVSVPLTVGSIVNDSSETAAITLDVQRGTALVSRAGVAEPIGVNTSLPNVPEGASIRADENVQALLTIRSPQDNSILETVQIYGSTDLEIVRAQLPRFQMSARPHQIELLTNIGRVRVNIANSSRPIEAVLITPQARTTLQEGSYAFEVSNDETQLTVREGAAQISAQGKLQELSQQQRTVVKLNGPPSGVLSPVRNLVSNGNFRVPLSDTWDLYNDLQNTREREGTVTIQAVGGQRSAVFERRGFYHAATGMRQSINADVRGFTSLRLHFVVQILGQDVPVCGALGTECPMMFELEYKDQENNAAKFLQGFYAVPDASGANPPYNLGSGNREEHQRIPLNGAYTYELNLIETLKPTQITSIKFYASGHTYHSSVAEVELLGEQ